MSEVSIEFIKKQLTNTPLDALPEVIKACESDSRKGVVKLLEAFRKKYSSYEKELKRIEAISEYEKEGYALGYEYIAGVDEVGRGPLAGPVVTAAVILPKDCTILGINDSKKLSVAKRESICAELIEKGVVYAYGIIGPDVIDEINILQATYKAMQKAILSLSTKPDFILADAVTIPDIKIPQKGIIKGDAKSISIGAASIMAKVTRDAMMTEFDKLYPEYHFAQNKGYGTKEHIKAIEKYGLCPIHRKSFVKNIIKEEL